MKTAAIIIAAYNCPEYIIECWRSVINQREYPGWQYDIRIGVDGCEKTADALRRMKIPYYWSPKNHGAYLIRNALIYSGTADLYCYFDADDIMKPDYMMETLEAIRQGHNAVIGAKLQCNHVMQPKSSRPVIESGGAMSFTHPVLEAVGGYYRHRCAGDTDLMQRIRLAGFEIYEIKKAIYLRRRHDKALTRSGLTRYGGTYRKAVWSEMCEARERGIVKIKPTIVPLTFFR